MGWKVSQSCWYPGICLEYLWEIPNLTRSEELRLLYTCPHFSSPCEASIVSHAQSQLFVLTELQLTFQEITQMSHIYWKPSLIQINHYLSHT